MKPSMYCRKCSYILDGLAEQRCPECGRAFDPARRRTYRTRPRGRWWLVALMRTAAVVFLLLGSASAWLYRHHTVETGVVQRITAIRGNYRTEPLGPAWLTRWAESHGLPTIDAVTHVYLQCTKLTENALAHLDLRALSRLRHLSLPAVTRRQVTDAELAHVKDLTGLERLTVGGQRMTDAGLVHLAPLIRLRKLDLSGTRVTDAGLTHLAVLTELRDLGLSSTSVTPDGLAGLRRLRREMQIKGP